MAGAEDAPGAGARTRQCRHLGATTSGRRLTLPRHRHIDATLVRQVEQAGAGVPHEFHAKGPLLAPQRRQRARR